MKRLAGCIVALLVSGPLVAQDYVLAPALQYSTGPNQKAPVESIVSGRGVRFDVAKAIGGQQPGTARYERPVMSGTVDPLGTLYGKFTSSTYQMLVKADPGVFSDSTVTRSIAHETAAWSLPLDLWNDGVHKQVVVMLGDSIIDSAVDLGNWNGLGDVWNQLWAQPVVSQFVTPSQSSFGGHGSTGARAVDPGGKYRFIDSVTPNFNKIAYTRQAVANHSRIVYDFGKLGWFFYQIPGNPNYIAPYEAWLNNPDMISKITVAAQQQLVFMIELGTNDFYFLLTKGVQTQNLWGSPSGGSPNLVTNGLVPMISMIRGQYPAAKIVVTTPIARNFGNRPAFNDFANGEFSNYADYVEANASALGIIQVVDTRQIGGGILDCRNWAAVTNNTFATSGLNAIYADGAHLTPTAMSIISVRPLRQPWTRSGPPTESATERGRLARRSALPCGHAAPCRRLPSGRPRPSSTGYGEGRGEGHKPDSRRAPSPGAQGRADLSRIARRRRA